MPFSYKMQFLQRIHRSESSILALDPDIVLALRRRYFLARYNNEVDIGGRNEANSKTYFRDHFERQDKAMQEEIAAFDKQTEKSYQRELDEKLNDQICSDLDPSLTVVEQLSTPIEGTDIHDFPNDISEKDGAYGFFGYFGLTISLAEFLVGARETGMHFLEREIESEREELQSFVDKHAPLPLFCARDAKPDDCENVRQFRLDYLRRLVTLLRLEFNQSMMLAAVPSSEIDVVRVRRWKQIIEDDEQALRFYDPDKKRRNAMLRETLKQTVPALCSPDSQVDGYADRLFGRFVNAEVAAKNRVLDYIAKNPGIVTKQIHEDPGYIDELDNFARELEKLDTACFVRLGVPHFDIDNANAIRARILDSVGGYWAAKGDNFGEGDNDNARIRRVNLDSDIRIKALCNAKAAYSRALDSVKTEPGVPSRRVDDIAFLRYDTLDSELEADDTDALPFKTQQALARVNRALDAYPAWMQDSACK
jgi:hypothetical protein